MFLLSIDFSFSLAGFCFIQENPHKFDCGIKNKRSPWYMYEQWRCQGATCEDRCQDSIPPLGSDPLTSRNSCDEVSSWPLWLLFWLWWDPCLRGLVGTFETFYFFTPLAILVSVCVCACVRVCVCACMSACMHVCVHVQVAPLGINGHYVYYYFF